MFRDAYEQACKFTFPVIDYYLTVERKCAAGVAAFVVINSEGWIVTAGHVLKQSLTLAQSDNDARAWEMRRDAIQADQTISAKERGRRLDANGKLNKKAARRAGTSWSFQGSRVVDAKILEAADLGVARLDPFDPAWVSKYPTFKDPNKDFRNGASLCKLGYPFVEIKPTYDEAANRFDVPGGHADVPFFPIEGMYTRFLVVPPPSPPPGYPLLFLETSSPGLRGQSGGPTFDKDAAIWAIQSQTMSLPLGFSPEIKHAGQVQKEHQFLNVGLGVHVATVLGFFNELGIRHTLSAT
jgi:hypothetical protein